MASSQATHDVKAISSTSSAIQASTVAIKQPRELLVNVNPLHGQKRYQKPMTHSSCTYYALNYIRVRYKDAKEDVWQEKRAKEKLYSKERKAVLTFCCIRDLTFVRFIEFLKLNQIEFNETSLVDLKKFSDFFKTCGIARADFALSPSIEMNACQHLEVMLSSIKDRMLPSKKLIAIIEKYYAILLKDHLVNFFNNDLQLDFYLVFENYLKLHNIYENGKIFFNTTVALQNWCYQVNFAQALFYLQRNIDNEILSSDWSPEKDFDFLLDVLEKNGPHVFSVEAKSADIAAKTVFKKSAGFDIYKVTFTPNIETCTTIHHQIVVVGGCRDKNGNELIYYIDPKNGYGQDSKTPVYAMEYKHFQFFSRMYTHSMYVTTSQGKYIPFLTPYGFFGKYGKNPNRNPDVSMIPKNRAPSLSI